MKDGEQKAENGKVEVSARPPDLGARSKEGGLSKAYNFKNIVVWIRMALVLLECVKPERDLM